MQIEQEEHNKLIKNIAKRNGIDKYELEIKAGSETGDGYIGQMVRVIIKNDKKQLNIILKLAPSNENYKKETKDMFLTEIFIYNKVLPAFDKFQEDLGLTDGFKGYPKCFGTCAIEMQEAISMENLLVTGYKLWNRKIPMDHDHLAIGMKEYGKFHAVSMGIRKKDPHLFQTFTEFLNKPMTEEQRQEMKLFLEFILSSVSNAVRGNSKLEKALKTLEDKSVDFWLGELVAEENQLVATHGDCWCNNIFFKYEVCSFLITLY